MAQWLPKVYVRRAVTPDRVYSQTALSVINQKRIQTQLAHHRLRSYILVYVYICSIRSTYAHTHTHMHSPPCLYLHSLQ